MLIDRQARGWIIFTLVVFAAATGAYVWYVTSYPPARLHGPSGGSIPGLTFGIVGTVFMTFAMLLSMKKRLRTMRVGRAYWWVQGHIWLGLLAYPLILFHSGLRFGNTYTVAWWLMWLFTFIVASGIFGVILQNIIPTKMLRELPLETIFEQLKHVGARIAAEAEDIVARATANRAEDAFERDSVPAGAVAVAPHAKAMSKGQQVLRDFYTTDVAPFLSGASTEGRMMSLTAAAAAFDQVRLAVPHELAEAVNDLQQIVDERRQLIRQQRLHHWLHGWLLIHVPLSFGLTVLAIVHIVVALRYL